MLKHVYQKITLEELGKTMYVCIDCGAQAFSAKEVRHYKNCTPGDSERWRKYYSKEDDDGKQATS